MGGQKQPLPKNWPELLPYLTTPAYSPSLTKTQLQSIRTRSDSELRDIPRTLTLGPCASVRITPIADPRHPACGQAGLFAARALAPGSLILPYYGELHPDGLAAHAASDYDLWLSRGGDDGEEGVAVDAAQRGNEARFVNDYRGVPGATRANAEFCEVWDARRGEKTMAVFVLPSGKRGKSKGGGVGIAKGQEILVSYGRGFWEKRRQEAGEGEGEEIEASVGEPRDP